MKIAFALAALSIAAAPATMAAEVGVRHESGASHQVQTGGRSTYDYSGSYQYGQASVSGAAEATWSGWPSKVLRLTLNSSLSSPSAQQSL